MPVIKPTQREIDEVLRKCADQRDEGGSKVPGMSYEEGVEAGIQWIIGEVDESPLDDE